MCCRVKICLLVKKRISKEYLQSYKSASISCIFSVSHTEVYGTNLYTYKRYTTDPKQVNFKFSLMVGGEGSGRSKRCLDLELKSDHGRME